MISFEPIKHIWVTMLLLGRFVVYIFKFPVSVAGLDYLNVQSVASQL